MNNVFDKLEFFTEKECRPMIDGEEVQNPYRVSGILLVFMDDLRYFLAKKFGKASIIITRGWDNSAGTNSQHHLGALDFWVKTDEEPAEILIAIEEFLEDECFIDTNRSNFDLGSVCGFGFYLDWKSAAIGFHLDLRGYKARWARSGGKYISFEAGRDLL